MTSQILRFTKPGRRKTKWLGLSVDNLVFALVLSLGLVPFWSWAEEPGVTDKTIRVGSTMPLEGDYEAYGQSGKQGIAAAFAGQLVQKRTIQFDPFNDFYNPEKAVEGANQLIKKGIFVMMFSLSTAATVKVLPILAEHKVPAFGFFIGTAFTGPGDVLNFRVSNAKEVETVIDTGLAAGLKPTDVCAYVQNDGFGMNGVKGLRAALVKNPNTDTIVAKLDQILNMSGESPKRNNIGPVGVYTRDTLNANEGYQSLKKWEATTGNPCRLIIVSALFDQAANFIGYGHYKQEPWIYSSVSVTAGDRLAMLLKEKGVTEKVIATQVVPPLDSSLPIVVEARKALGNNLNFISLEAFIVGRLFVAILQAIDGPITRENFLKAARRQPYDIGGVKADFTTDNQGSDYVGLTLLRAGHFLPVTAEDSELLRLFK